MIFPERTFYGNINLQTLFFEEIFEALKLGTGKMFAESSLSEYFTCVLITDKKALNSKIYKLKDT